MMFGQKIEGLPENDLDTVAFSDLLFDREVGRGSFGQVSKASYFGSDVAVKVLTSMVSIDPDYFKFMTREIKILKEMRHSNIVQYLGACTHEGKYMIVTEYIKGGDLHQYIKEKGIVSIPWNVKLRISLDIASAFSYLHSKKIIFRDLKTKNILVDEIAPGVVRAKVCDFGFARTLEANDLKNKKDGYLTICGSETSMAPEVLVGMKYDSSCDVYSYGVLLLELICGTRVVKTQLKRAPSQFFEMNLDRADFLAPDSCPKAFMDLAKLCLNAPEKRPTFMQIIAGLKVLVDSPVENLEVKGKSKPCKLDEEDDNQILSDDDEEQQSGSVISRVHENGTANGSNYATVIIRDDIETSDSVVYLPDQTLNGIDYGGRKHNRITNPSFFKPPSSNLSNSIGGDSSVVTTATATSGSNEDEGSKNLSSLFTNSLSLDDIKLRTPDPNELSDLIQKLKPHISSGAASSPNLATTETETNVPIEQPLHKHSLSVSVNPSQNNNQNKKPKAKKSKGKKGKKGKGKKGK